MRHRLHIPLARLLASMTHAAGDQAKLRMALKKLQLPQQPFRRDPIVSIETRDEFSTSRSAAVLQRFGNSESRLG